MKKKLDEKTFTAVCKRIENFYEENPYVQLLKLNVESIEEGEVALVVEVEDKHTNFYGIAHGGMLMSVADTAMGATCLSCNKKVVTLSFSMNFIKAMPTGSKIKAIGKVLHNGSRTMMCETELFNEEGIVIGKASGSFFVMGEFVTVEQVSK